MTHLEHLSELGNILIGDLSHLGFLYKLRQFPGRGLRLLPVLRPGQEFKPTKIAGRPTQLYDCKLLRKLVTNHRKTFEIHLTGVRGDTLATIVSFHRLLVIGLQGNTGGIHHAKTIPPTPFAFVY